MERIEQLRKAAAEKLKDATDEMKSLVTKIGLARASVGLPEQTGGETIESAIAVRASAASAAAAAVEQARVDLASARDAVARARGAAADHTRALEAIQAHEGRLGELRRERADHERAMGAAEDQRVPLLAALATADEHRRAAAAVEERRTLLGALERQEQAAADWERQSTDHRTKLGAAEEALRGLVERRRSAEQGLVDREAIRALASRVEALREALGAAKETGRAVRAEADQAERDRAAAEQEREAALRTAAEHLARARRAEEVLVAAPLVEQAEKALPERRADVETAVAAHAAAVAEVERLRELAIGGKDKRLGLLRTGLTLIRDESGTIALAQSTARDHLSEDDAIAAEHAAAPEQLRAAERVAADKDRARRLADQHLGEAERLAERRGEMERARADRAVALAAHAAALAKADEHKAAVLRAEVARDARAHDLEILRAIYPRRARRLARAEQAAARLPDLAAAEATIGAIDEQIVRAQAEIDAIGASIRSIGARPDRPSAAVLAETRLDLARSEEGARRLVAIAQAEATIAGLDAQIARDRATIAAIDEKIAGLGAPPIAPPIVDLAPAETTLAAAERGEQDAVRAHVRAEADLDAVRAAADRIGALEAQLREAEEVVADWTLCEKWLGPTGIQALLIDAAGPELTALVNDLLRSCFGPRYTVRIETTRPKKKPSDGDKEVCDVLVFDARAPERGWREGQLFSGGERTILGEAIALGLTAMSCRRAGLRDVTLVRDETGGGTLDEFFEANATAYIVMLRRAAEIIGASKVLFILHSPAAWALADAVLLVRDGQIRPATYRDGQLVVTEDEQATFEEDAAIAA